MFEQPIFIQNTFNVIFPRREKIRRDVNALEDKLADFVNDSEAPHYSAPQIISVPDDLDPRVPRIIFDSRHGFSRIAISQISLALSVTYSPEWQRDIAKGKKYLAERVPLLFDLLSVIKSEEVSVCGLNTSVQIPCNTDDSQVVRYLSEKFLVGHDSDNTRDINLKTVTVIEEKFYSNITIENYRSWDVTLPFISEITRLPANKVVSRGIAINSDFNDRHSFNENSDYKSSRETAREIVGKAFEYTESTVRELRGES